MERPSYYSHLQEQARRRVRRGTAVRRKNHRTRRSHGVPHRFAGYYPLRRRGRQEPPGDLQAAVLCGGNWLCVRRCARPSPGKWQQFVDEVKQAAATGGYKIGAGLVVDEETNTLSVDTAEAVEEDNTKPITSAAVYTQLGNGRPLRGGVN